MMHCTVLRGSVDLHPMPPEAVLYQLDFTKLYILGPAPAHTYDGTAVGVCLAWINPK